MVKQLAPNPSKHPTVVLNPSKHPAYHDLNHQGRSGSVRLRFGGWNGSSSFRVFGSSGSSKEGVFVCFSTVQQRGRFWFRFSVPAKRFPAVSGSAFGSRWENGSDGSGFPVPVRFLGHPES